MKKKTSKELTIENTNLKKALADAEDALKHKIDLLQIKQQVTDDQELSIVDLKIQIQDRERDLHVLELSIEKLKEEVERLIKKSNAYYFELEEMRGKKIRLPKLNWDYLNYLYFLPVVAFVVVALGVLGFVIYTATKDNPRFLYFPIILVVAVSAPFFAAKGERKLRKAGLL